MNQKKTRYTSHLVLIVSDKLDGSEIEDMVEKVEKALQWEGLDISMEYDDDNEVGIEDFSGGSYSDINKIFQKVVDEFKTIKFKGDLFKEYDKHEEIFIGVEFSTKNGVVTNKSL